MGIEEVINIFSTIAGKFSGLVSGTATSLALVGIALIAIVVAYYLAVLFIKATRAFLNMKTRYLGVFALLLGLVLITIAIII